MNTHAKANKVLKDLNKTGRKPTGEDYMAIVDAWNCEDPYISPSKIKPIKN